MINHDSSTSACFCCSACDSKEHLLNKSERRVLGIGTVFLLFSTNRVLPGKKRLRQHPSVWAPEDRMIRNRLLLKLAQLEISHLPQPLVTREGKHD